ncbi:NAD-dependent epimerase [Micromonospora arborensis]|uniref:NAD-dependent epimerase n=1 Tax=Micromonospora arborensis TaxID=2116518 RepID=A0A318NCR0_9ACTN|nr:NAD(P)H-binding protein [Micromonospora arborensis]PYC66180.1 NAD-dependent epimerase [Micromonospora arborensis]
MKLVVFGANGPTGRLTTEMALARGHAVTAVTRRPEPFPISGTNLRVVRADAMDAAAVDAAIAGQQAVISSLGIGYTKETVRLYSRSAANIIAAMKDHGLRRFVGVTSTGTTGEHAPGETFTYKRIVAPILLKLGRTVYEDMERMEKLVSSSGLDWTVIRPAGLFDGHEVTDYQAGLGRIPGRFTSRTDLADLLIREATENLHLDQFIEVVTTTGAPTLRQTFIREALHIGK